MAGYSSAWCALYCPLAPRLKRIDGDGRKERRDARLGKMKLSFVFPLIDKCQPN